MPILEPTICCCDNRGCVQVVEDPGRHRVNTTHVDASAFKVREYVQRRRVEVRWIPTGECLGDIFTKHTIEADQFFKLWHTLCGYRSWSVLEEITGKAAAVAVVVEGWYFSVQDTKACNMLAAACRTELNAYSQAAGLGVGATTWMELGESRAAEEVSRSMGVQGMARGQASPKGSQRTPRTGPEGSSPLYRGTATAEDGPGRAGRV